MSEDGAFAKARDDRGFLGLRTRQRWRLKSDASVSGEGGGGGSDGRALFTLRVWRSGLPRAISLARVAFVCFSKNSARLRPDSRRSRGALAGLLKGRRRGALEFSLASAYLKKMQRWTRSLKGTAMKSL